MSNEALLLPLVRAETENYVSRITRRASYSVRRKECYSMEAVGVIPVKCIINVKKGLTNLKKRIYDHNLGKLIL